MPARPYIDQGVRSRGLTPGDAVQRGAGLDVLRVLQLLRSDGGPVQLLVLDLKEHSFEKAHELYGDLWLGFKEAALHLLEQQESGVKAEIEPIVFHEVYPQYGVSDIRSSSTERNLAIQGDLVEHVLHVNSFARVLADEPDRRRHVPHLRHVPDAVVGRHGEGSRRRVPGDPAQGVRGHPRHVDEQEQGRVDDEKEEPEAEKKSTLG